MGVHILSSTEGAAFFCSTTQWAFGPIMPDADIAEAFIRTFGREDDPRSLTDEALETRWNLFRSMLIDACPKGHCGEVEVDNQAHGVTHFTCYAKGCRVTWNLEGSIVEEEEDDE